MGTTLQHYKALHDYSGLKKEWVETAWRTMCMIRAFEEKSIEIYKKGLMGGSLHLSIGQEAVATGVCMNLNNEDQMTMTYRGRGQAIAKGADPFRLFAELLGRIDGYCKGKGGPMHITTRDVGILGANGIVGAGIPIAVGAALSAKIKGTSQVAVTFFGDGATNQGAFHEALNLAAIMRLPIIFVCENNMYSEMTPTRDTSLNEHIAERGIAYGIDSIIVDGNKVEDVYFAAKGAIDKARAGDGPTFIEAKTYRLQGHMFGDPESYRTKDEVNEHRQLEPIVQFQAMCQQHNLLSDDRIAFLDNEAKQEIEVACQRALESEQPGMGGIYSDVY